MGRLKKWINLLEKPLVALLFVALIRIVKFVYFSSQFLNNWPEKNLQAFPFIEGNDTPTYFNPMESFVETGFYDSLCRMPGLLPIYAPLRWFLEEDAARIGFSILQLLTGIVAVYIAALIAKKQWGKMAYFFTLFVFAFSSFLSIWDHLGYSDSFSVYFLIFSVWFAVKLKGQRGKKAVYSILLSSLFIIWSIFIRPIHLVALPGLVLLIFLNQNTLFRRLKALALFALIPMICLGAWTWRNYQLTQRVVILQDSISNCYQSYPHHYVHLRDLMIRMGGDYQKIFEGTEMHWYQEAEMASEDPFNNRHLGAGIDKEDLYLLRDLYRCSEADNSLTQYQENCRTELISRTDSLKRIYQTQRAFDFYLINPIHLVRKFVFPGRLDNLPLPARENMNLFQFGLKSSYLLLFHLLNLLGLIGITISILRFRLRDLALAGIPIAFILIIAAYLGFIEQRYFTPIYPFMILFSGSLAQQIYNRYSSE